MMNEDTEQFEQKLSRQPLKPIPVEWREQILSAARSEASSHASRPSSVAIPVLRSSTAEGGLRRVDITHQPSTLTHKLSTLLWPHPAAWAGLAAIWLMIFGLNFMTRDKAPVLVQAATTPLPQMVADMRQQQKMLAELIGPPEVRVADRQRTQQPKPRSERQEILAG
jgi:hypothetical protein